MDKSQEPRDKRYKLHDEMAKEPRGQKLVVRQNIAAKNKGKYTQTAHPGPSSSRMTVIPTSEILSTTNFLSFRTTKTWELPSVQEALKLKTAQLPHQTFGFPVVLRKGSRKFESAAVQPHISHY
uniref:Uncharacterized protein n=1 Tax=Physcomitrium patens TaxID=3218 RepID=A0A2K1JCU3_PHYPA|nr:hypothetical protein PHYPA_019621 [Physcomitrium patens]